MSPPLVPLLLAACLTAGCGPSTEAPQPSDQPAADGKLDLAGADLAGRDLRGRVLRGADLRGADLTGADLTGADLRGADLREASLDDAVLDGAMVEGADFTGIDLRSMSQKGFNPTGIVVAQAPGATPALQDAATAPLRRLEVLGYELVVLPSGRFQMGSRDDALAHQADELLHEVRLERPFAIGTTEVTQDLYRQVMDTSASLHGDCGPRCPVDEVNWCQAVLFCNRLSESQGLVPAYELPPELAVAQPDDRCMERWDQVRLHPERPGYRLPTEAEWEYAARAGRDTMYAGSNGLGTVAWYELNAQGQPHPVGEKEPNAWGLYDMTGNVWEWVWDWYGPYPQQAVTDPVGPDQGSHRISRGGAWYTRPPTCSRLCYRQAKTDGENAHRPGSIGFRLARSLP